MAVIAIFKYDVRPGRMADFIAKLKEAADPKFTSKVMPKSLRLFRSTVPGPDTGHVIMQTRDLRAKDDTPVQLV